MNNDGNAFRAFAMASARETYDRYMEWFKANPKEPMCYWSKDEPIRYDDKNNEELLAKHPEIEDIDDHTVVFRAGEVLYFIRFCPRLRKALKGFLNGEPVKSLSSEGLVLFVIDDRCGNYTATLGPFDENNAAF